MSSRKKVSRTRETARLKVSITKSASGLNEQSQFNLSRIRTIIPLQDVDHIVSWIRASSHLNRLFFPSEFPKTFLELEPGFLLLPSRDEFEYRWTGAFLAHHAQPLQEFVKIAERFEHAVLRGNYQQGIELLDEIEVLFGHSIWLISNRLALLQLAQGLEAQKLYAKKVIQESASQQLIGFITFYISIRNESSVTPNRFIEVFSKNPSLYQLPDIIQWFVKHHLFPNTSYTSNSVAAVLAVSSCCSVVDTYEALVKTARTLVAAKAKSVFPTLSYVLQNLFAKINDTRLHPLLVELNKSDFVAPVKSLKSVIAFDHLLEGKNQQALTLVNESLEETPNIFDLWEIKAKALSIQNSDDYGVASENADLRDSTTFYNEIIKRMAAILSKPGDVGEHKIELIKIALNFNSHSWANALLSFVRREFTNAPIHSQESSARLAILSQANVHPLRVLLFDLRDNRVRYKVLLENCYPESTSLKYAAALIGENGHTTALQDLAPEEQILFRSEIAFQHHWYDAALQAANLLCASPLSYYRHRGIKIKVNSLLKLNSVDDAVKFVASALVKEPYINDLIPLAELTGRIDKACQKRLRNDVSLPVIYDLHSNLINSDHDSLRNYAYEDFLLSNGIERPSELKSIASSLDANCSIYFLEKIAIESVMDISTVFGGSQDIAKERLKVCEYLIEINPNEAEMYKAEINEINRRLRLQQRSREVEQSKIYVDTESIKKKVAGSLGESFNRYIAFLKHNYDSETLRTRNETLNKYDVIKKIVEKEGGSFVLLGLNLPENEMAELFNSMFLQLRDEYVSGKEHGLDTYLSVRIRHGTLTNQLRSHLESLHLITQRESAEGPYKNNEHWKEVFEGTAVFLRNYYDETINLDSFLPELNKVLADFSKNFDDLIQEIVSEWIQVKKKPEDKGLFNFVYSYSDIQIYSKEISIETGFDEFIERIFAVFRTASKLA